MARNKIRAGTPHKTSLWDRIAGALGISVKETSTAQGKYRVVRKHKIKRNKRQTKHKKSHHKKKKSSSRSARTSQKHQRHQKGTARHSVRHRSIHKRRAFIAAQKKPVQAFSPPKAHSVWNIPYPHLPKILFTRIELPSVHLPSFHRKKRVQISAGHLEDFSKEKTDPSQNETTTERPSGDLADLLTQEDASRQGVNISKQEKKQQQQESGDISNDLLEKKQEIQNSNSPDVSQKEAFTTQSHADAIAAKRKKSQASEMVMLAPMQSTKKQEKKTKEKKTEAPEPSTEEQMLQAMEARAKREKKKGITVFFRSLNNMGMGKYRSAFVQNLAMMLNAGLPLIDALHTIKEELRSRSMRKVIQSISDLVEGGNPLWVSMDEQGLFSPYEVSLVRVGEEAGNLARNMEYLSIQQEKDRSLRQKVKMAMIYPTIVLVLMFIVVMGLGMFVLPNLIQVLYALNVELPLSTRLVIMFTEFMQRSGAQTGAAVIGAFITILLLTKYTAFKAVTQWFIFRIPGIGRLAKEASIARFGVILGGLLQAGGPLVESLDSMVEVTTIVSFKRFYQKLRDRVVVGDSFATCFHTIRGSRKVLPVSVQQLIITGEKSGALSDTCMKVAHIYECKAEETAGKLPVILEPVLLICIGGLVGFIAFSIIVPIYSAVGNVSGG